MTEFQDSISPAQQEEPCRKEQIAVSGKRGITNSKARWYHKQGLTEDALALAEELEIPVINRDNKGIPKLMEQYNLDCLLVEEDDSLVAHWRDGQKLAFHPNMSVHRIRQLKSHEPEMLHRITNLQPGESFLDCTMGFGADSIVASFLVGESGRVVSLESSDLIYGITSYGLRHWPTDNKLLKESMYRIETVHTDYLDYLRKCEPASFDVVYLDPMFEKPIYKSENLAPLRREANSAPLTGEALTLAKRVAKRMVVVKHRANTLEQFAFDALEGGTYSRVAYGILYP